MPAGAVPVVASRPLGGWRQWIFWVVQAVTCSGQATSNAIAPVAGIPEHAAAAAPEITDDVNVAFPAGSGRPVLRLVVLASSFCCPPARNGRWRHACPTLRHSAWL